MPQIAGFTLRGCSAGNPAALPGAWGACSPGEVPAAPGRCLPPPPRWAAGASAPFSLPRAQGTHSQTQTSSTERAAERWQLCRGITRPGIHILLSRDKSRGTPCSETILSASRGSQFLFALAALLIISSKPAAVVQNKPEGEAEPGVTEQGDPFRLRLGATPPSPAHSSITQHSRSASRSFSRTVCLLSRL